MTKTVPTIMAAVLAAFVALTQLAGPAHAVPISEQQVKNTCGKRLESGGVGTASAIGCEKKCGANLCTYGCVYEKKKLQRCDAVNLGRKVGAKSDWQRVISAGSRESIRR